MIDPYLIAEVEVRLTKGQTPRAIVKALDHRISRSTVAKIANGTYHRVSPIIPNLFFQWHPTLTLCANNHFTHYSPCVVCAAQHESL